MRPYYKFLAAACFSGLAACGGGGGTGVPPIVASGPPPADLNDLVGLTFPLRVATLETNDGGMTRQVARANYSITLTSLTTATLNTPDGAVDLTENLGIWEGTANGLSYFVEFGGLGFDYSELLIVQATDLGPTTLAAVGTFGFVSPQSAIDANVTGNLVALYTGESLALLAVNGVGSIEDGTAALTVDFGTQSVMGSVFTGGDGTSLDLVNGQVTGNGISGELDISGPGALDTTIATSDVDGTFYGLDAFELNGTFAGSGTNSGDPFAFSGIFNVLD